MMSASERERERDPIRGKDMRGMNTAASLGSDCSGTTARIPILE